MTSYRKPLSFRRGFSMFRLAASLLCTAPAFADVIRFERQLPAAYLSGESIEEAGYKLLLVEGPVASFYGVVGGTGTVLDSANPFSCDLVVCPAGGDGKYLGILNDGAVQISATSAANFSLVGFSFAFLAPVDVPLGNYGQLVLSGLLEDGSTIMTSLNFPGQNAAGDFVFSDAALDADFSRRLFSSLSFSACLFDGLGSCFNSVDNPAFNQAQFAIDDIELTAVSVAVPEPGSFALVGLSLAALALARRRRVLASTV